MSILQGYRGWTAFNPGGSPVPVLCRPGAVITSPRNLYTPSSVSNVSGLFNYTDGIRVPTMELPLVPMAYWFTTGFLQSLFQTYTVDDLAVITGGIGYADSLDTSYGTFGLFYAKGSGYTLSTYQGSPLTFTARFMGTQQDNLSMSAPFAGIVGTPLQFNSVSFGGGLALAGNNIAGFSLMVDNGLVPNLNLTFPLISTEINKGITSAILTVQSNGGAYLSDFAGPSSIIIDTGFNIVTFYLPQLICENPGDRKQQTGRVFRTFKYTSLAATNELAAMIY